MDRVGDMTREELKQLIDEVVEERLERALRENGVKRASGDSLPEGMTRKELLQSIRRSSQKLGRPGKSWTNPVMEEREALRNWKPTRELKGHEWITEERKLRSAGQTVSKHRIPGQKRGWRETSEEIDRIGWSPPANSQSPQEMLREDRDR